MDATSSLAGVAFVVSERIEAALTDWVPVDSPQRVVRLRGYICIYIMLYVVFERVKVLAGSVGPVSRLLSLVKYAYPVPSCPEILILVQPESIYPPEFNTYIYVHNCSLDTS